MFEKFKKREGKGKSKEDSEKIKEIAKFVFDKNLQNTKMTETCLHVPNFWHLYGGGGGLICCFVS